MWTLFVTLASRIIVPLPRLGGKAIHFYLGLSQSSGLFGYRWPWLRVSVHNFRAGRQPLPPANR